MCLGAHSKVRGQFEGVVLFFHNMGAGGGSNSGSLAQVPIFLAHIYSQDRILLWSLVWP